MSGWIPGPQAFDVFRGGGPTNAQVDEAGQQKDKKVKEPKSPWNPLSVPGYLGNMVVEAGAGALGDALRGAATMPAGATGQTPNEMIGDWPSLIGGIAKWGQSMKPFQYDYEKGGNIFDTDSYWSPHKQTFNNTWNDPTGGGAYKYALNYLPAFRSLAPKGTLYNKFRDKPGVASNLKALRAADQISHFKAPGPPRGKPVPHAQVTHQGSPGAISKNSIVRDAIPLLKRNPEILGYYKRDPGIDPLTAQKFAPRVVYQKGNKPNKRHELQHRIADAVEQEKGIPFRTPNSVGKDRSTFMETFKKEKDANIAGHKSLLGGIDKTLGNIWQYVGNNPWKSNRRNAGEMLAAMLPNAAKTALFPFDTRTPRLQQEGFLGDPDRLRNFNQIKKVVPPRPEGVRDDQYYDYEKWK